MTKTKLDKYVKPLAGVLMAIIILITISTLENTISDQQESQIEQLSDFITYEINRLVGVNTLVESYQTTILETTSKEIIKHFDGRNYADISTAELNTLKEEYNLSGIALFKDVGDDVIIEKSTSEVEVGLSTEKWGFWYTAFRQLLDEGYVSIEKGTSKDAFWIGPRSKAYEQKGFFIFTYEKAPGQAYLLNLFLDDKKAFDATDTYDTNAVLASLVEQADFIDEIAIINVDAWNNRFQNENRSKLQDFTLEYGTYKSFSAEDTYYLNKTLAMAPQDFLTLDFNNDKHLKTKRYIKLSDHEVLIFVLNKSKQYSVRMQVALTVFGGLLSVWLIGLFMTSYHNKRFTKLLDLEKKRLMIAESYKQTVQILPSVVLRLSIIENKFVVRHCEGKALKLIGVDATSTHGQLLDTFMPAKYIDLVSDHLSHLIPGESSRFEYTVNNHIFENKIEWAQDELIILWNDITELRESEDKAKFMAYHDNLTELPNRRFFKETVVNLINTSTAPLYLAFIDLDGFKNVNDTAGHDIGDELLIEIAHRLTNLLGQEHVIARMGGDEFAVLFKNIQSISELELLIERVKLSLSKTYTINGSDFTIGISMGISKCPEDGHDYITLMKKADIALYAVKYSGKGTHKFYDPSMSIKK